MGTRLVRSVVGISSVVYSFFMLSLVHVGHADPIQPPDLNRCEPTLALSFVGPRTNVTFDCCLPLPTRKVIDFSFETSKIVNKVRRAAHLADAAYIHKYNKAYELMKALPADDPRSFAQQANVHCAFCNGGYNQTGADNVPFQVHFSWLFLPWHRWYLYFHERILASLIGDPEFALLYWNWDNQVDGNEIPAFYAKHSSAVYDEKRSASSQPPSIVKLNLLSNYTKKSDIIEENLNFMYQAYVTAFTPELFYGGAYRVGTLTTSSTGAVSVALGGSAEFGVHNAIHAWLGNLLEPLLQDMSHFSTAARDPIFYSHHSNVDRLWEVWKHNLPGGPRLDHTDPDFLNAEFIFYDENANLVKVKVKDALDTQKLGITYSKAYADQLWINYSPNSTTTIPPSLNLMTIGPASYNTRAIILGKRLSAWVLQPTFQHQKKLEVLTIQGLEVQTYSFIQLLVFLNLPNADENTKTNTAEFVGNFNIIPTGSIRKRLMTNVKFEIGDNIKRIGLQGERQVIITLVVKTYKPNKANLKIKGLKINYE